MVYKVGQRTRPSRKLEQKSYHTRVWLNGKEVTNDTFYVDVRRGIVRMFLRDAEGHVYLDPKKWDEPAWVERRGRVTARPVKA